jgi:hypothetical protein
VPTFAYFTYGETHCGTQFLQMLAHFVHRHTALLCRMPAQLESRLNLFAKNSLQSVRQRFAQFQTEAHRVLWLFVGEPNVAITFFASYLPSKPGRRLELAVTRLAWKFHFGYNQTKV